MTEYDIADEHHHVALIRRWLPEIHKHERIEAPLEDVIKSVQSSALERWASAKRGMRDRKRAEQMVGRYGAFCREVDFELDFTRILAND